jgi:HSP20 family protein
MLRRTFESPFELLHRDIDRAFGRIWGEAPEEFVTASYPVDIRETDDQIIVDAELPGFRKEDVSITLEQNMLSINAMRKVEEKKGEAHLNERRYTRVSRAFTLPTAVDENKVDAKLEGGVLTLTLNKREEVKPRRIEVK